MIQAIKRRKQKNKGPAAGKKKAFVSPESEYDSGQEDYSDSDDEGSDGYKKGGYHPVFIGELYKGGRYSVLKKLGWGHFSTVWLVMDKETGKYGAMKVQKSAEHYTEAAQDEITLCSQIRDGDPNDSKKCVRMYDSFTHSGLNGKHVCMVFEVLGDNLLALIKRYNYRGIPVPIARNLVQQMLVGMDYIHRELEIIHTDFKPENVMLVEPLHDRVWELPSPDDPAEKGGMLRRPASAAAQRAGISMIVPRSVPTAAAAQIQGQNNTTLVPQSKLVCDGEGPAESATTSGSTLTKNQKKALKKKAKKKAAKAATSGAAVPDTPRDADDDEMSGEEAESRQPSSKDNILGEMQKSSISQGERHERGEGGEHFTEQVASADVQCDLNLNPSAQEAVVSVASDADLAGGEQDQAGNGVTHCGSVEEVGPEVLEAHQRAKKVIVQPGLTKDQLRTAACKLVDFGNACWVHKQFTTDIQTRQYRSPEVIMGAKYSTPCDMWSMACLVFELVTGDVLFDPKAGDNYDRDEDHLALFIELLGKMPRRLTEKGKHASDFFKQGELRHIKRLKFWPLESVLFDKYKMSAEEARSLASFLKPMLEYSPERRATAAQMLEHPWLRGELQPTSMSQQGMDDEKKQMRGSEAPGEEATNRSPSLSQDPEQPLLELEEEEEGDCGSSGHVLRSHEDKDSNLEQKQSTSHSLDEQQKSKGQGRHNNVTGDMSNEDLHRVEAGG
ncbi:hypothetical protein CEUSTIGMA_g6382.t1 [Chlamydomonas eustigma]|uniref:non-specific serine/threonine protein kinase n=1 Tax=Chlamydomonas eustigma TaxID=1157962 RepID=A0A250X7T0_9CHLO|nr:hypothetical protein CEUSTIGMA_g6382.t1 [Chlamydomonas eustigma]|eukprot:GAX78942.1 hypothetical protein CEUSTIGMA_g6382.t1 [Chlamydomonas eustigma]